MLTAMTYADRFSISPIMFWVFIGTRVPDNPVPESSLVSRLVSERYNSSTSGTLLIVAAFLPCNFDGGGGGGGGGAAFIPFAMCGENREAEEGFGGGFGTLGALSPLASGSGESSLMHKLSSAAAMTSSCILV